MEAPQAPEAKNSATATKHDVVKSLAELPLSIDGLTVPGIATGEIDQRSGLPVRGGAAAVGGVHQRQWVRLLLNEPDPRTDDESLFFVSGVELADHTIATLRNVEGRQQYQQYGPRVKAARRSPNCKLRARARACVCKGSVRARRRPATTWELAARAAGRRNCTHCAHQ